MRSARPGIEQDPGSGRETRSLRVHVDRSDQAGVHVGEHEVTVHRRSEAASDAELGPGDADRRGEGSLREVTGLRSAVIRVSRSRAAARLVGAPAEVRAFDDQVDLVVALGTVLGLPQPIRLRIEREPERVAVTERPDPRTERIPGGDRPIRVDPQDLAAKVPLLLTVRGISVLTGDDVELVIRPEEDPPAVVIRRARDAPLEQHAEAGARAVLAPDAKQLVHEDAMI